MNRRELVLLLGSVIFVPRRSRAQQKTMPVIGFLSSRSPGESAANVAAFRLGLREAGCVEGQDAAVEYSWAEGRYDRLPALAAGLVAHKVDVIMAAGGIPSAQATRNATPTIPIVFTAVADPVAARLVASLARPGGNLTGFTLIHAELMPKRLELLSELVPQATLFALLVKPNNPETEGIVRDTQEAARAKRLRFQILKANDEDEIDGAFASLAQMQAGALLVDTDPFFFSRREQLVAMAARYAIPAIYDSGQTVRDGGLIGYGTSGTATWRQVGIRRKILNGAKPADLPVQQPTTFELVVNLKTAKALGLTVLPSILARADEVIE
jgi:putative ABC transport system substrate-binding protein